MLARYFKNSCPQNEICECYFADFANQFRPIYSAISPILPTNFALFVFLAIIFPGELCIILIPNSPVFDFYNDLQIDITRKYFKFIKVAFFFVLFTIS